MITYRQINIENRPYYIFNDTINIKNFDPNLLSVDKISFKSTDAVIYNIKYIAMKSLDNENIDRENYLYVIFNNVDGYNIECNSIEESNGDKYLIFASTGKNKEVLKKYTELWDEMKNQIETINGGKPIKNKKGFMGVKFKSNNDLPLGKIAIPSMIIVVGSVLQKDSKYYLQVHLQECLYEFVSEL